MTVKGLDWQTTTLEVMELSWKQIAKELELLTRSILEACVDTADYSEVFFGRTAIFAS